MKTHVMRSAPEPKVTLFDQFGKPIARATDAGARVGYDLPVLSKRRTAGQFVDEMRALYYDAVWRCVTLIAGTIKMLPFAEYKARPDGKGSDQVEGPGTLIVDGDANDEMTRTKFFETMQHFYDLWGNAYGEIERSRNGGKVFALHLLTPDRVEPKRDSTGRLVYDISNGSSGNTVLNAENVFHLKWLAFDGVKGHNVVRFAARAVGLALAQEVFAGNWFANGAQPSGALTLPPGEVLDDEDIERMQENWRQTYGGDMSGNVAILEGGATYTNISSSPSDSQMNDSRAFQVGSVARVWGVPPAFMGDMAHASLNNFEQMVIMYAQQCIVPRLIDWESEWDRKICGRKSGIFSKFNVKGLLRGDSKTQALLYKALRESGVYSTNEIRAYEDLNPIDGKGGDLRLVPGNFQSLERAAAGHTLGPAGDTSARATNLDIEAEDPDDDETKAIGQPLTAEGAEPQRPQRFAEGPAGRFENTAEATKAVVKALTPGAVRWGRKHSKVVGRLIEKAKDVDSAAIEARTLILNDRESIEAELTTMTTGVCEALLIARGRGLTDSARGLIEKSVVHAVGVYGKRCGDAAGRVLRKEPSAAIEEIEILEAGQLAEDCAWAVGAVLELTA